MAHVAPRVGEPDERACVALPLLGLLDAAERAPRRQTGIVRRQPVAAEVVFEQREVRAHFAREFRLRMPVADDAGRAAAGSVGLAWLS